MTATPRRAGFLTAARRRLGPAVAAVVALGLLGGCSGAPEDPTDVAFAVRSLAADGSGGYWAVGGQSWLRATPGGGAPLSVPWDVTAMVPLPGGDLVVGTLPIGATQTPQVLRLDPETATSTVLAGLPGQRPLPLVAGQPVSPDGTPALDAWLGDVLSVTVAPDGSPVWAERLWIERAEQHAFVVRGIAPDGSLTTLAGRGGDPTVPAPRPAAGSAARDVQLSAPDPQVASLPDGTVVVATRDWIVLLGSDGRIADIAAGPAGGGAGGFAPCATEPPLAVAGPANGESADRVLLRVGPGAATGGAAWTADASSERATQITDSARAGSSCTVVSVAPATGETEAVPGLEGSSAVAWLDESQVIASFTGSGDEAALVRVLRR